MIICPNLKHPDVAREFNEIVQATSEKAAYHIWSANNGNGIDRAPNGAHSVLFDKLLVATGGNRKDAIRLKAYAIIDKSLKEDKNGDKIIDEKFISDNLKPKSRNNRDIRSVIRFAEDYSNQYPKSVRKGAASRIKKILDDKFGLKLGHWTDEKTGRERFSYKESSDNFDYLKQTQIKDRQKIEDIINNLNEVFSIKFNVQWVEESQPSPYGMSVLDNAMVTGNTVYLRSGRVTTEIVAEELLHTFIYNIKHDNPSLYNQLLREARNAFKSLSKEVQQIYVDDAGRALNQEEELITKVLARYYSTAALDRNKTLKSLVKKVFVSITKYFKNALPFRSDIDKFVAEVGDIQDFTTFKDLTDILMQKNVIFNISRMNDGEKRKNVSNSQESESVRRRKLLFNMFKALDKTYAKMRNKNEKQTIQWNKIHERLTALNKEDDATALSNSIKFALQTMGVFDAQTLEPQNYNTVLGYLYKHSQTEEPFSNVSTESLYRLYKDNIRFYNALMDKIFSQINSWDLSPEDAINLKELRQTLDNVNKLYKSALYTVSDKLVDKYVDEYVTAENQDKETMKEVLKDWLHRNMMHEDISLFKAFVMNNSQVDNPIIKQVFHMIQISEHKTRVEVLPKINEILSQYYKLNSIFRHPVNSLSPNWQKKMIEYIVDENGSKYPSGNFIRERNYGQALHDFQSQIQKLHEYFDKTYGFHYIWDDDLNTYVRSSDRGNAYDEDDYETSIFIKYLKEVESIKDDIYERQYTLKYYLERLSAPYNYQDPDTQFNHGLRPSTIQKMDYIQSNINFYLKKTVDPETGYSHPEQLSINEQRSLKQWQDKLDDLSQPYDEIGDPKSEDEIRTAFEIQAWNNWLQKHMESDYDEEAFYTEANKIEDPVKRNSFLYFNSTYKADPRIFKGLPFSEHDLRAQLIRNSLLRVVRTENDPLGANIKKISTNTDFWLRYKQAEQDYYDSEVGLDKDDAKRVAEILGQEGQSVLIPYQKNGMYQGTNGQWYTKEQYLAIQKLNDRRDEGQQIVYFKTWFDVVVDQYVDYALNNDGEILNYTDENGDPVRISATSEQQIRDIITNMFTVKRERTRKGVKQIVDEPLSIFSVFLPHDGFKVIPNGRFSKKSDADDTVNLINKNYDNDLHEAEQPKLQTYENKDYQKLEKDTQMKQLYDLLLQVTNDARAEIYGKQYKSYKFALQSKTASQIFSNIFNIGLKTTWKNMWNAWTDINNNDDYIRSRDEYRLQLDGTTSANDLNIRFENIENQQNISEDIVQATIAYMIQASNYKHKSEILPIIETYQQAMDDENRGVDQYGNTYKYTSSKNSSKMFKHMMDAHVYDNRSDFDQNTLQNKRKTILKKIGNSLTNLFTLNILGFNFMSIGTGWYDSITRQIQDIFNWKYSTPRDMVDAAVRCLMYQIPQILNYGMALPNNKQSALMQRFGTQGGVREYFKDINTGRTIRTFRSALMLGFQALDYFNNSILLSQYLSNCRFYKGDDKVPAGFYTRYQLMYAFKNAGRTKSQGAVTHMKCLTTLRNAYKFDVFTHQLTVKPQYQQYVTDELEARNVYTKAQIRQGLINGVNPENDRPMYKDDKYGKYMGAMRGWLLQIAQNLLAGSDDVSIRTFTSQDDVSIRGDKEHVSGKSVLDKKTQEQRRRAFSYNYETGMSQDQQFMGMFRTIKTLFNKLKYAFTLDFNKFGNEKLSVVDKNSWLAMSAFLIVLTGITLAYKKYHDYSEANMILSSDKHHQRPDNLQDIPRWFQEDYIGRKLYLGTLDAMQVRTIQSKISSQSPTEAVDVVHEMSVLNSGFNDISNSMYGLTVGQLTGDPEMDQVIKKKGKYKGFTKREKLWSKLFGVPDNLVTSFTENGIESNRHFYGKMIDWYMDLYGIDLKQNKKKGTSPRSDQDLDDFSNLGNLDDMGGFDDFGGL